MKSCNASRTWFGPSVSLNLSRRARAGSEPGGLAHGAADDTAAQGRDTEERHDPRGRRDGEARLHVQEVDHERGEDAPANLKQAAWGAP